LDSAVALDLYPRSAAWTYDDAGRPQQVTNYTLDQGTMQWSMADKTEHEYDGAGLNFRSTSYVLDPDASQWLNFSRSLFTYDADGRPQSSEQSYWNQDQEQWEPVWNETFTHDIDGWLIAIESQYYDPNDSEWENNFRWEMIYSNEGLVMQEIQYEWDQSTMQWSMADKTEHEYDGDGQLMQVIRQCWCNWDGSGAQWRNERKDTYTYDAWGDIVESISWLTEWGNPNTNWYMDSRTQPVYDNAVPFSDLLLPITGEIYNWNYAGWYDRFFNHKLLQWNFADYDTTSNSWVPTGTENYFYSLVTLSSVPEQNVLGEWQLYPNPAQDVLHLQGPVMGGTVLTLRDLQGRTVLQQPVASAETISLAGLPAGLYTYTLQSGGHMRHGKLLKN
jgi:hypothetical protein